MKPASLEVVLVEGEEPITAALAAALSKRGHLVATVPDVESALARETPDAFVCGDRLTGGTGFDLLAAILERGDRARTVLLLGRPSVEDCQRAMRLGAGAILTTPFRIPDLVHAVEQGAMDRCLGIGEPGGFSRSYRATGDSSDRCARDLSAFALLLGVPSSTRARIAGAACEIVDNARRHARLSSGSRIRVRARVVGGSLEVSIHDDGAGFDPSFELDKIPAGPALTGLARARALAEEMEIHSRVGAGCRVELRFAISSASLSDGETDLSEADYLPPRLASRVLGALLDGESPDVTGVSPALAVVLGRLLAPGPAVLEDSPHPR